MARHRSGSRSRSPLRRKPDRTVRVELTHLPGLGEIVAAEAVARLRLVAPPCGVPGRDDAVTVDLVTGNDPIPALAMVNELSTVVAGFVILDFGVRRPGSLAAPAHVDRIAATMRSATRLASAYGSGTATFRIDAAGSGSPAYQRLARALAGGTGMSADPIDGAYLLRIRRPPGRAGWQVLVRLSPRPLSARPWRRARFPGALNATVAAAAVRLTGPRPTDRVLNLMCGSGTLLVERLLAGSTGSAVGVDRDPTALRACDRNLTAAGVRDRVRLERADIADHGWAGPDPYDVVLADPPWGDKVGYGENAGAQDAHRTLLARAAELGTADVRFVVVSHRIAAMGRCLREEPARWELVQETRVWAKGHHPRIYLLRRRAD